MEHIELLDFMPLEGRACWGNRGFEWNEEAWEYRVMIRITASPLETVTYPASMPTRQKYPRELDLFLYAPFSVRAYLIKVHGTLRSFPANSLSNGERVPQRPSAS